jgi:hypothetical protein
MNNYILSCLVSCLMIVSIVSAEAQIEATPAVEYNTAMGYVEAIGGTQKSANRVRDIPENVETALKEATFHENYKVDGKYQGVQAFYGKDGDKKLVVLLPEDSQQRLAAPSGDKRVYVVEIAEDISGPCPPFCD